MYVCSRQLGDKNKTVAKTQPFMVLCLGNYSESGKQFLKGQGFPWNARDTIDVEKSQCIMYCLPMIAVIIDGY